MIKTSLMGEAVPSPSQPASSKHGAPANSTELQAGWLGFY